LAKGQGNIENLKPKTSASARGRLGAIACAEVKRRNKVISSIYAEMLAEGFEFTVGEGKTAKKRKLSSKEMIKETVAGTLARCDNASVAMLREVRENTEKDSGDEEGGLVIIIDEAENESQD